LDSTRALGSLEFAKQFEAIVVGPRSREASLQLEPRNEELLAALAWFIDNNETDKALYLVSLLWGFWIDKGHVEQSRKLVTRLLKLPGAKPRTTMFEMVLYGAGMLAFRQDDNEEAGRLFEECLALSREKNDSASTVRALTGLARIALREGDYARVKSRSEEARKIARSTGDEWSETRPLHMLAAATKMEGNLGHARELYLESLALARRLGDQSLESVELDNLGSVSLHKGDIPGAKDWYRQAGELMYKQRSMYMLPYLPLHFSVVALEEGKVDRAVKLLGASEALFESSGMAPDPDESGERDRTVSRLRQMVEKSKFSRLWEEGRKLPLDKAVQYALET
jgi:tetratricopeptide (TPR) repeat protein